MLGAILDGDCSRLESLVMENIDHINDPIGMPFETPNSRFFGHPIMNQMVIGQHSDQTLLDVACGMPCGPGVWVLLTLGAKGSRHPLGTDLALHNAIKNGRPYTVQALVRPGRSNVNGVPGTSWKPLLQAVFWNHPEIVRILLRKGAHLEDAGLSPRGSGYQTALQLCLDRRAAEYHQDLVREKCNEILRQLLEAGANIHAAPPAGSTTTNFEMFVQPFQKTPFWAFNSMDAPVGLCGDNSLTMRYSGIQSQVLRDLSSIACQFCLLRTTTLAMLFSMKYSGLARTLNDTQRIRCATSRCFCNKELIQILPT
jgi:hypothetical protein